MALPVASPTSALSGAPSPVLVPPSPPTSVPPPAVPAALISPAPLPGPRGLSSGAICTSNSVPVVASAGRALFLRGFTLSSGFGSIMAVLPLETSEGFGSKGCNHHTGAAFSGRSKSDAAKESVAFRAIAKRLKLCADGLGNFAAFRHHLAERRGGER